MCIQVLTDVYVYVNEVVIVLPPDIIIIYGRYLVRRWILQQWYKS